MGNSTFYRAGDLFGVYYNFDKSGEGISMHKHEKKDRLHNVIVLKGKIRVRMHGGEFVLSPSCIPLTINDASEHEIMALEDDTRILNINLYGVPEGFEDEHDGAYAGPVDFVGDPHGR